MDPNTLLSLENFPKAKELFRAVFSFKYNVIFYGGAVRGGKTFNLLGCLVLLLRMYPGARAAIVRKDSEMLKRATLPSVKKVFPPNFLRLIDATSYRWEADNRRYGAPLNGEVFFFGENYERDKELTRWDGLEVNFILIDQIEGITKEGFTKALERVGSYFIPGIPKEKQPPPIILASLNPSKNWIKSLVYDRWKEGQLPDKWTFIPAFITDNPFVPDSYKESLEQLKTTNPREYARRVLGDWNYADDPSALVDPDRLNDMTTNEYVEEGSSYITADVARFGRDSSVILVWKGFKVVDIEIIEKSKTTYFERRVKELARKYQVSRSHIIIDADGVGGGPVDHLQCRGFVNNSRAIGKTRVEGKNIKNSEIYANLKTQCGYLLAQYINDGKIHWAIQDPDLSAKMKEEVEQIREKSPGSDNKRRLVPKDEVKKVLGRSPDISDSLIERMFFVLKGSSMSAGY